MAEKRRDMERQIRDSEDGRPGIVGRLRTAPEESEDLDATVGEPDDGARRAGNPGSPSQHPDDYDDDPSTDSSSR